MQLRYDDDFIETAVFLCAAGKRPGVPSLQIARFHRERERLYAILDPDERSAAFFRLHLDWFREWGLENLLTGIMNEFPLLAQKLATLAVRKARGRNDEGAELYVNAAGQANAVVALRPESLERNSELSNYLRHEFTHVSDMLDPAFGYAPRLELCGLNAAQQRLARERYRLLWDITIDGRLAAARHVPLATRDSHEAAFARAYPFWADTKRAAVFEELWQGSAVSHSRLLDLIADPRGLRDANRPAPGASCPLCDFPTFNWVDATHLAPEISLRIATEFPNWNADQGLCNRCHETYEALVHA